MILFHKRRMRAVHSTLGLSKRWLVQRITTATNFSVAVGFRLLANREFVVSKVGFLGIFVDGSPGLGPGRSCGTGSVSKGLFPNRKDPSSNCTFPFVPYGTGCIPSDRKSSKTFADVATLAANLDVFAAWRVGMVAPCASTRVNASWRETGRRTNVSVRASRVVDASLVAPRPRFNDGSDTRFSPLLNGMWTLAGGHGSFEVKEIMEVMQSYARRGYTTFDTADIYGPSERILGDFYEQWRTQEEQPLEMFTKFVPNIFRETCTPKSVEKTVRNSMNMLKVDKIDLVQMHWWDYAIPGMVDAALALTELKEKGLIKSIGMTNMGVEAMDEMWNADVPIVCNQVQFSMIDRRPLNGMVQFCKDKDIKIFAYGSVMGGLLSERFVEEPAKVFGRPRYTNVNLDTSSLKMYWALVKKFSGGSQDLWRELLGVLEGIAQKHGVTVTCVAIRWVMDQGDVYPIIGVRNAKHLEVNEKVLSLVLDIKDQEAIDEVLSRSRGPTGDIYSFERGL